jgi:S-adenosylmethionine:tRNA ribosyltransferase-isomerase
MLVLDRANRNWTDSSFKNFTEHLRSDDVVVVNNSRVIPARLKGRREETGGQVEIFLVRELEAKVWDALVKPGGRLKAGSRVVFDERRRLKAEMLDGPGAELRRVRFYCEGSFERLLGEIGVAPLPPYIKRIDPQDGERYQKSVARSPRRPPACTSRRRFSRKFKHAQHSPKSRYTSATELSNRSASMTWTNTQLALNVLRSPGALPPRSMRRITNAGE